MQKKTHCFSDENKRPDTANPVHQKNEDVPTDNWLSDLDLNQDRGFQRA